MWIGSVLIYEMDDIFGEMSRTLYSTLGELEILKNSSWCECGPLNEICDVYDDVLEKAQIHL
jgi:hypothetical protein